MTSDTALQVMAEALESLRRSGIAEAGSVLTAETVLIGPDAVVDSVGFVTFVAEIEDRLSRGLDEPIELILTDIWQFNAEDPSLKAGALADYCARTLTS